MAAITYLIEQLIILNHLLPKAPDIQMEPEMRRNIRELVHSKHLNLPEYPDRDTLSLLVMQVESYFTYSVCKSALY